MSMFRRMSLASRIALSLALTGTAIVGASVSRLRPQAEPQMLDPGLTPLQVAEWEEAGRQHLDYLPNQVLVKFKEGTSVAGAQRALMALRSRPDVSDLQWIGDLALLNDLGQANGDILAAQLREQPEVEYAQPNYIRHLDSTPNDPSYATRQWDMTALDMPRAWDINGGASGIIVAIVDTGPTSVTQTFAVRTWSGSAIVTVSVPFAVNPDLPASRQVLPRDFATNNGSTVLDMDGHGTHVSGTVGEETNNGVMLAGMAYKATIMPIKACISYWDLQFARSANGTPGFVAPGTTGGCPDSATVPGIRYAADNGAKVVNYSIGGPGASPAHLDALNYAVGKGTFVAMAAGNEFEDGNPTGYPAAYAPQVEGAMSVASVGRSLRHAWYSSSGAWVEIAATGGDLREAGTPGGIWQSAPNEADFDDRLITFPRFDRYVETPLQGTSMASPHVAGLATLLYSQLGSGATPAVVEQMIKKSARTCTATSCDASATGSRARNDLFGAGLIQPRTALFGSGVRK